MGGERGSRGGEKVLAGAGGKVQRQGEGVWVQAYLGTRGAKACKQGACMGGGSEGRRGRTVIYVLRGGER